MKQNKTLCQMCANARRSPRGYVEGCGVANARTAVQMYGRCVEATLSGECCQFTPVEKQKPA